VTIEHPDECFRRFLQTVDEVFTISDAVVRDAGADLAQKFGVVLFGKFVVDETAQRQTLRENLTHCGGETVGSISATRTIVLGNQTADGHAREIVEQWNRLPDRSADILKIHVDSGRAGCRQLGRKIRGAMIECGVEAKFMGSYRLG
jgi:hypothetical protein